MRRVPDYIEYPIRGRILIISGTGIAASTQSFRVPAHL